MQWNCRELLFRSGNANNNIFGNFTMNQVLTNSTLSWDYPTVCVYWVEMEEQFLRKRIELKSWPWPNWSNKGFFVDISRVLRLHIEVPRVPHQMSEHIMRHSECFYRTLSHLSDTIVKLCILFHDVFAEAKCTVVAMTHSSSCKMLLPGHSFAKVVNILTILKIYDLSW